MKTGMHSKTTGKRILTKRRPVKFPGPEIYYRNVICYPEFCVMIGFLKTLIFSNA
jgi:hypothetical protein